LLVLFDALQSDEMAIKKADYVRTLREKYRDLIMHLDFESEGEEETSLITSETLPTKPPLLSVALKNVAGLILKSTLIL